MGGSGALVASIAAVVTALVAGLWGVRQAKAAANPMATMSTAYAQLFDDLRAEVDRLQIEVDHLRSSESKCQVELSQLRLRVALLENKEKKP
jgi:7-keto-8-aminopelargonate synthetase-like enzyme